MNMDAKTRKRYKEWRRRKIIKRLATLMILLGILIGGHLIFEYVHDWNNHLESTNEIYYEFPPLVTKPLTYDEVSFRVDSQNALLFNRTTGQVLFTHGADERVYPASLTKIMTVLLGIELAPAQTMIVNADFNQLLIAGATVAGFAPGETRTLSEVLHGAMLPSGADATATIAYNIAGSYEEFVLLMNQRATELGMDNTNFTNASGLHHPNHYTTANDMLILLEHALKNQQFRTVFTAQTYSFTYRTGELRNMISTMFANMDNYRFNGGQFLGGRTGFTNEAGRCLASLASNDTDEFLLITFGANPEFNGYRSHIDDARTIFEYFLRP